MAGPDTTLSTVARVTISYWRAMTLMAASSPAKRATTRWLAAVVMTIWRVGPVAMCCREETAMTP
ncbi:hypothetical protein D3C81_1521380 [compost metagenome]